MDAHEKIIRSIQHQQQIEGKDTRLSLMAKPFASVIENVIRLQDNRYTGIDASNEVAHEIESPLTPTQPEPSEKKLTAAELTAQIKALERQLADINTPDIESDVNLDEGEMSHSDVMHHGSQDTNHQKKITPTHNTLPTIRLDSLRSTAASLPMSHLFSSSHQSKVIKGKEMSLHWDIPTLKNGLKANCEAVACSILGEPVARTNGQLRFGNNKGSLILTLKGSNEGQWFDHQTGKGGDMLALIQSQKNCGFKQSLDFAGEFLNLSPENRARDEIDLSDLSMDVSAEKQKTIQYARQLANQSRPIKGTLAETYLKKNRGIDTLMCSDSIRFLASVKEPETDAFHPALLVVAKNMAGHVQGVQAIFLDKEGNKLKCQEPKRSYGLIKGSVIPVHEGGNLYAVAEGAETALSIATACKDMTVFASLGSLTNFSAMDFQAKSNTIIIFTDNDHQDNPSHKKSNDAADELKRKGFNVLICTPNDVGKDFNDVLREKGVDAVREHMNKLIMHESRHAQLNRAPVNQGKNREKKFESACELGF